MKHPFSLLLVLSVGFLSAQPEQIDVKIIKMEAFTFDFTDDYRVLIYVDNIFSGGSYDFYDVLYWYEWDERQDEWILFDEGIAWAGDFWSQVNFINDLEISRQDSSNVMNIHMGSWTFEGMERSLRRNETPIADAGVYGFIGRKSDMALDPTTDSTIYFSCVFCYPETGIYRSLDYGVSWERFYDSGGGEVDKINVSPFDSENIVVTGFINNDSLQQSYNYISTDDFGITWYGNPLGTYVINDFKFISPDSVMFFTSEGRYISGEKGANPQFLDTLVSNAAYFDVPDDQLYFNGSNALYVSTSQGLPYSVVVDSLDSDVLDIFGVTGSDSVYICTEKAVYLFDGTNLDTIYGILTPPYSGPVWYVSTTGSDSTGDGSEENPFATIQFGIDNAEDGDTVLVEPGRYVESIVHQVDDLVVGSRFLTTLDTSVISQTVIDGNGSQISVVVRFGGSDDTTSALVGFTITNGGSQEFGGGGVDVLTGGFRIKHCVISDNIESGGVNCLYANLIIRDTRIVNNRSDFYGGGIDCLMSDVTIENSVIAGNTALFIDNSTYGYGGGIFSEYSTINLRAVSLMDNEAGISGGGIFEDDGSTVLIDSCIIKGNIAYESGGGIFTRASTLDVINTDIRTNSAQFGAALFSERSDIQLDRTVIARNNSLGEGIVQVNNSVLTMGNSTVAGNILEADIGLFFALISDASSVRVVNSIFWNIYFGEIFLMGNPGEETQLMVAYSDIKGDSSGIVVDGDVDIFWGDGNIHLDPRFLDEWNGDLQLMDGSPCIDAGTPFFVWDGDTLVDVPPDEYEGNAPDMGAYESEYTASTTPGYSIPDRFHLYPNTPNPFNPVTTIRFDLPESGDVQLVIYDILGREVEKLVSSKLASGEYEVVWDATNLASGIYVYRLSVRQNGMLLYAETKKLVVLK